MLMASTVEKMAEAGYRTAILWVLDHNVRAIRFYEATGWRADGTGRTAELAEVRLGELRYRRDVRGPATVNGAPMTR